MKGWLLQSQDDGATWSPVLSLSARRIRSLVAADETLYAGTDDGDVLAGRDGGQTWVSIREGLPQPAQVFALALLGSRLFAGLYARGLYVRNVRDGRWEKVGSLSPLVLAAARGSLLAGENPGGLHYSDDTGQKWSAAGPTDVGEPSTSAPVWTLAANHRLAFAGASSGLVVSRDQGRAWEKVRGGMPSECPGVSLLLHEQYVLSGTIISEGK